MPYNPKHKPHLQFGAITDVALQNATLFRSAHYAVTLDLVSLLISPIEDRVKINAQVKTDCTKLKGLIALVAGSDKVGQLEIARAEKVLHCTSLLNEFAGNSDAGGLMIVANEGGLKVIDSVAKKVAEALAADDVTDKVAIEAAKAVGVDEGKKAGVETGKAEGLSTGRLQGAVVGGIAGLVIGRMTTKG